MRRSGEDCVEGPGPEKSPFAYASPRPCPFRSRSSGGGCPPGGRGFVGLFRASSISALAPSAAFLSLTWERSLFISDWLRE